MVLQARKEAGSRDRGHNGGFHREPLSLPARLKVQRGQQPEPCQWREASSIPEVGCSLLMPTLLSILAVGDQLSSGCLSMPACCIFRLRGFALLLLHAGNTYKHGIFRHLAFIPTRSSGVQKHSYHLSLPSLPFYLTARSLSSNGVDNDNKGFP